MPTRPAPALRLGGHVWSSVSPSLSPATSLPTAAPTWSSVSAPPALQEDVSPPWSLQGHRGGCVVSGAGGGPRPGLVGLHSSGGKSLPKCPLSQGKAPGTSLQSQLCTQVGVCLWGPVPSLGGDRLFEPQAGERPDLLVTCLHNRERSPPLLLRAQKPPAYPPPALASGRGLGAASLCAGVSQASCGEKGPGRNVSAPFLRAGWSWSPGPGSRVR